MYVGGIQSTTAAMHTALVRRRRCNADADWMPPTS